MKFIYSNSDGSVCIVHGAPKENLEKVLGPLTDDMYKDHIKSRSIPTDALNVREINESDIPSSREFRNAWVDVSDKSCIDICCTKAKNIQLQALRAERNKRLVELDKQMLIKLEKGESIKDIAAKKQQLRDCTECLKTLDTSNKINDTKLLEQIKQLGTLNDLYN